MKKIINLIFAVTVLFTVACSQVDDGKTNAEMTFKEDLTFDYGTIQQNGDGVHEFEFKNTGSDPLIITNVKSSCGCTVPSYPKGPIKKGDKEKIHVKYNTKHLGTFRKTITVYSNAKNSPIILHIKGEVLKPDTTKTN